jgi:hypothetical protein
MFGHAALGRYALGQMPSPVAVSAAAGAIALTGANAALSGAIKAGVGSFAAAGADAALLYAPGTKLAAAAAAFTVSGSAATFNVSMPAQPGSFAVAGFAAGLDVALPAVAGAFSATGTAGLRRGLNLYARPDAAQRTANYFLFAPLGARAFGDGPQDAAPATTFSLNGTRVEFNILKQVAGGLGLFVLSGQSAALNSARYPSKVRVFPSVGRGARGVSRGTEPIRVFASTGHGTRRRAFGG